MFARLLLTLSLVFCCFQTASAEERPEVGRYVKAFSGDTGVKVWMVRIGPESNHEVIIQVVGVDHPWDRVIPAQGRIQRDEGKHDHRQR
jgi:hypothetical protein